MSPLRPSPDARPLQLTFPVKCNVVPLAISRIPETKVLSPRADPPVAPNVITRALVMSPVVCKTEPPLIATPAARLPALVEPRLALLEMLIVPAFRLVPPA